MILAIIVLAVGETAWALYAAETSADLLLFYVMLVAASAIFFLPGIHVRAEEPRERPSRTAQTNG